MIAYQKLTKKELDTFIQMRIRQLREEREFCAVKIIESKQMGYMIKKVTIDDYDAIYHLSGGAGIYLIQITRTESRRHSVR